MNDRRLPADVRGAPNSPQLATPGVRWRHGIARYRRDARGVASIEMAFIFPVMLLVYFGLVDVSNLLSANRRVTLTASTLGDLVTQVSGQTTTSELKGYFTASSPIMDPFPSSDISLEIYNYTKTSDGVKLSWQYKNATANCGAAPSPDQQMENLMAEGNDVVVSRVCFKWTPVTGKLFGIDPILIQDKLMLRPRQSAKIECKDCA